MLFSCFLAAIFHAHIMQLVNGALHDPWNEFNMINLELILQNCVIWCTYYRNQNHCCLLKITKDYLITSGFKIAADNDINMLSYKIASCSKSQYFWNFFCNIRDFDVAQELNFVASTLSTMQPSFVFVNFHFCLYSQNVMKNLAKISTYTVYISSKGWHTI